MARRIASAAVLMPIACAGIWLGAPWIVLLIAAVASIMAWEWGRLVGRTHGPREGLLVATAAGVPVLTAGFVSPLWGIASAAILVLGQQTVARAEPKRPAWTIGGLFWIVLPCIAFDWMRGLTLAKDGQDGFAIAVYIVTIVWSVDIAAYLTGRALGGPRLAPRLSPKKTWAGLIGGMAAAVAAGAIVAKLFAASSPLMIALASAGLAVIEQMGDMAESYAKRRFGVKDTGGLIPGHGGMLDRLDGMLAVVVAVYAIVAWR